MKDAKPPAKKRSLRHRVKIYGYVLLVFAMPILCFVLYASFKLSWSYSDGDRSGVLQKFSRRGWICKTYEGEIALAAPFGAAPVIWEFTVRDDDVAKEVNKALGRKVVLHYKQHTGVPTTCFGDTEYFVDSVEIVP